MKKLSQKGFTLVEGLLIIIALALVVGVGYYVYNTQKKNDNPKSAVTATKQTKTAKSDSSQTKYLEIKELGIKVPLSAELSDMKYSIPQTGEIMLTSAQLGTLETAACGKDSQSGVATAGGDRIMSISKVDGDHVTKTGTEDFFLKQFDGFYIKGSYGNQGCGDPSESAAMKAYADKSQQLYDAANEAVKNSQLL